MPRGRGNKIFKTPQALGNAVAKYFLKISKIEKITEPTPLTDDEGRYITNRKGDVVMAPRPVLNDKGEEMYHRIYIVPPSVSGLCLDLNISRKTWAKYCAEDGYKDVCDQAKLRIEAYLTEQLNERKKNLAGIIFNLQNNYGWREKKDITGETSNVVKIDFEGDLETWSR